MQSFARQAERAGEQAVTIAQQIEQRMSEEHARRVGDLKAAKAAKEAAAAALRACTENCGSLQRSLAEAGRAEQAALARADASAKAVAQAGEALRDFGGPRRSFETALQTYAPQAKGSTEELSSRLQQYLAGNGSSATAPTGNGGNSTSSSPRSPGTRSMEDIDLRKVIDDRSSSLNFEKVSRDQVAWGLDRLKSVVEPALRMGKGLEYFASRDSAEGLSGERSYSGVYNWFYNSQHAIKLTRASGGLVVSNGYHRLAVARELGIETLPAVVR